MLTGMTTVIVNGARGIGINAGHRTNNKHVRITLGSRVLKCYTHTYMHVRCTYGCMYVQYKTTMATEHTSRALSHTVDLHTSTMDAGIAAYAG